MTQQLINALSLGSIYALLALGLAVVFSVLGLLNFAYGEIVTVTSYGVVLCVAAGAPLFLAVVVGFTLGALTSLVTEAVAFRPMRRAPAYAVVFSSFAVAVIIQATIRNVISPRPQGIAVPAWLDRVLSLGTIRVPVLSLITIAIAAVAMVALSALLQRSRHGIAMQAAAQDFQATRLMGAKAGNLIRLAFLISGVLAAVAGLLWVMRVGSATPGMGFTPLLQAFVAVVLGGLGNLRGAVAGGFALAFLEVSLQVFLPNSLVPFVQAITLTLIIVLLYFRPHGFGRRVEGRLA
ncbi:branched-chain amino acid ABC transporter permease [Ornithinimicrobium sp. W1665]|uniref:branched-chain amino acid ABC transporter permease n=1 Tax=Ornithinimicrobium sp. W1665 TaxID=3416666 RepID=UPI003CE964FE